MLGQLCNVHAKLDHLLILKENVDFLLQQHAKVDGLLTLKTTYQELKAFVNELKESIESNAAQYGKLQD